MPVALHKGEFVYPQDPAADLTGAYIVSFTLDTEEHAIRTSKNIFQNGLAATVSYENLGIDRSYLKFGRLETEKNRVRVECQVGKNGVSALIDYLNNKNPTGSDYDYPVPDIIVTPLSNGNKEYIAWI